ncbi:dicarboxylate/amino acid:cation symporter [Botrimarina mediterranea]|uniref:Proton glutamate symport protein n=1 Tax=Botrimarina mediterranea TaxID=2528022 RepID=A0A518KEJ8_9BACT|nr:dicarboxylate/amino acid:cation symporter [Botrimarina mediterranea]QDV76203.1 Proton glutamate symport protein [Botrimarina mediterranea]
MPLHVRILIGMVLGVIAGAIAVSLDASWLIVDWVKPFGTIFINLLKVIAVPLIIASLVKGVSDMRDLSRLSSLGGRTVALYLFTTVVSVSLGLLVVNLVNPGLAIDEATRTKLLESSADDAAGKIAIAEQTKEQGPLQPIIDLVPDNIFAAATNNTAMLQVIVFVLLFGVALVMTPEEKSGPVKAFFDGLNEVVMRLIDLIMLAAPIGVFALLAALVAETPSWDVFKALLYYSLCVMFGLMILVFGFYPTLARVFAGVKYGHFFRSLAPAQLLAFSTSSSAATLPVTMECTQEHLGVDEEVASFVLPIGATVNMDGTSLYQAVAAVFIAQAFGIDLTLGDQLSIVLTATLASIGTAAVPSAGIVMLVIVLGTLDVPEQGIALIFAVDRVLDMSRTVANVTSDATVATLVAKSVGLLHERPEERRLESPSQEEP